MTAPVFPREEFDSCLAAAYVYVREYTDRLDPSGTNESMQTAQEFILDAGLDPEHSDSTGNEVSDTIETLLIMVFSLCPEIREYVQNNLQVTHELTLNNSLHFEVSPAWKGVAYYGD